jgi:hypothetical protein
MAPDDLGAILLVGFDYLVGAGFARMLSEPHPERDTDPVEAFLAGHTDRDGLPIARILAAAWRAALDSASQDASATRAALRAVLPRA